MTFGRHGTLYVLHVSFFETANDEISNDTKDLAELIKIKESSIKIVCKQFFFCGNIIMFFLYIILFGTHIDACELTVLSELFCYLSRTKNEDRKRKRKKSDSTWARYIHKGPCPDFIYM